MENCQENSCRRKISPTEQEAIEDAIAEARIQEQEEKRANRISNAGRLILFFTSNIFPENFKPTTIYDYVWAFGKDPDEAVLNLKLLIAKNNFPDTVNAILGGHILPVVSQNGSGGGAILEGFPTNITIRSFVSYCAGGNPASMTTKSNS